VSQLWKLTEGTEGFVAEEQKKRKSKEEVTDTFAWREKSIALLEGSQAAPAFPSDKNIMKMKVDMKTLEWRQ
jgi:hypothetical protein